MHTRLGPGREKVYSPAKTWSGFATDGDKYVQWRQVTLKHHSEGSWAITVLGSNGSQDAVGRVKLDGGLASKQMFELKKRNVRILGDAAEHFQTSNGEIYLCMYSQFCISDTSGLLSN